MNRLFLLRFSILLSLFYPFCSIANTSISGLAVVVDFIDYKTSASDTEIQSMINQSSGFSNWGNIGSVNEYFDHQSNGEINLTCSVIRVTLNKYYSNYNNSSNYDGGQALVNDVVAAINQNYPSGFNGLTIHPNDNRLWCFLLIKSAPKGGGVAYWVRDNNFITNDGSSLPVKTVALVQYGTNDPSTSVVCHEFGHHLFAWTDYYFNTDNGASNIGHYGLMGSGGSKTTPMAINPALRYKEGWIPTVRDIDDDISATYTVAANNRKEVYKYTNPLNPREYYMIEALLHDDYYVPLTGDGYIPDQGLAIWYVDESGYLGENVVADHPKIKLVQADGMDEMHDQSKTHRDWRGDDYDLFDDTYSTFSAEQYPLFAWKDGSESGLYITNISAVGSTMNFTVSAKPPISIIAQSDASGQITPRGFVGVNPGESQTFTITPKVGYEISDVLINGISQGPITSYTFTDVTSDQSIYAEFSEMKLSLPDPWVGADIGTFTPESESGYIDGTFRIKTFGSDIYWGSDKFHYVYRSLKGNGEIIARVADMTHPQSWTKSGVMIRESTVDNSRHIMMVKTTSNGLATQYRTQNGGSSSNTNDRNLGDKQWIRLKRDGSTFTTYYSDNGTDWQLFDTRTIYMNNDVYIGLCATGSVDSVPNISLFDSVQVISDYYHVSALSSANNAGTVSGSGEYYKNTDVSVSASANSGYTFSCWTENGDTVSTQSNYSFTLSEDRKLVANFTPDVYTQEIYLLEGWNLVSLYISPENTSVKSVFPDAEKVKTMDAFWNSEQQSYFNSLHEIEQGIGYLVYNSRNATVSITGQLVTSNNSLTIKSGWNLIGVLFSQTTSLQDAYGAEFTNIQVVKDFDKFWLNDGGVYLLNDLEPGKSYFVKSK